MELDFENLLQIAIKATFLAGKEIQRQYNSDYETLRKADGSLVTSADMAANDILMNFLDATDIAILSEESDHLDHEFRQNNTYWCIDPIDGTHDFVNKTDEFCVSVGLVDENTSKLGVLYAPALNLFYFAAESIGSYKIPNNLSNLEAAVDQSGFWEWLMVNSDALPNHSNQEKALFMASRYHRHPRIENYIIELRESQPDLEVVTMGSAIKLGLMAERKANEYLRYTTFNFWDVAGGHAICKYAGLPLFQPHSEKEIDYKNEHMHIEGYQMKW